MTRLVEVEGAPALIFRQEYWLGGNKLFSTRYEAQGEPTRGAFNNAVADAEEKANLFTVAANETKPRKDRLTPGDIELRIVRTMPIACASFFCELALSREDAVWIDPITREASTGERSVPYHISCAPNQGVKVVQNGKP